jgi:hypothetical protein
MGQTPSGRAKYYLNLARQRSLKGKSVPAPRIDLTAAGTTWTRERSLRVAGKAHGSGFVDRITINGRLQFNELAAETLPFSDIVNLQEGFNRIMITVHDLAGNSTSTSQAVTADWQPPEILFWQPVRSGNRWILHGNCEDDGALATLAVTRMDGTTIPLSDGTTTNSIPFQVELKGDESVWFEATDLAGNVLRTEASRRVFNMLQTRATSPTYAQAGSAEGVPDVPPVDAGKAAKGPPEDDPAPELQLDVSAITHVVSEEAFLSGRAADESGLASLRVDGKDILAVGQHSAIVFNFSRRIPLAIGTNVLHVVAEDLAGHRAERSVTVVRRLPSHLDTLHRLSVMLPPLASRSAGTQVQDIQHQLQAELVREPVRFFLLERAEGWDPLLRELALSASDMSDPRAALKLGKIVPVDLCLLGIVLPQGHGTTVYAMVVDTESAEVLAADDVYSEKMDVEMELQLNGLVTKLKQRFPLLEGTILRVSRRGAEISVGLKDGVRKGMQFLAVDGDRATSINDGAVREINGHAVQLEVESADDSAGRATWIVENAERIVHAGDFIYAR